MDLSKRQASLLRLSGFDNPNAFALKGVQIINQKTNWSKIRFSLVFSSRLFGSGQCCQKSNNQNSENFEKRQIPNSPKSIKLDMNIEEKSQSQTKISFHQLSEQQPSFEDTQNTENSPNSFLERMKTQFQQQNEMQVYKVVGDNYALRKRLGKGAWGNVHLATYVNLDSPLSLFAIKEMPLNSIKVSKQIQELVTSREIKNMTRIHHKNIVALLDFFQSANNTYLVMEYCEGGTLKDYIDKNKYQIQESTAQAFIRDLSEGLKALYENKVLHRDLKPENLLLTGKKNRIKICDLGFSKDTQDESEGKTKCGTGCYMAHEILKGVGKYTYKVDL